METLYEENEFFNALINGLAAQFGPLCEIVLHDLKDKPYDHTIVAIKNGNITGRKVGDCGTNLGLQVLQGTDKGGDKYNYITQTKSGRILRSTSIYIRNSKSKVIGALCINFDITDFIMAEKTLSSITQGPGNSDRQNTAVVEVFANDVNDLLDSLIQESMTYVGKPPALMTKEDKLEGIKYLDQKGALLIKKSGNKIAKSYGISKYTLYSYLEEVRAEDSNEYGGN
jgi:predicted transcriptional regulator YheO